MMRDFNRFEMHSEEVQEIMGRIPGWILGWGLTIIFSIILLIIIGSYFVRFPDIVKAPLIITTYNTPTVLNAKEGGKIEQIFVSNEQMVKKSDVIAVIGNVVDYKDILALDTMVQKIEMRICWDSMVVNNILYPKFAIGSIQNAYVNFRKTCHQFRHYINQELLPSKYKLLGEKIDYHKTFYNNMLKQYKLKKQDLELGYNSFKRDSLLFAMEINALDEAAYESSWQTFIQKRMLFFDFENNLKEAELAIIELKEQQVEVMMQHEGELEQYRLSLDESWQLLKSSLKLWKERYVVITPIEGRITFTNYWSTNQVINAGDRLATVVPNDESRIIAKAFISPSGLGKVKKGQEVHIKLSGFPFREYGTIKGVLTYISLVPEKEGYVALIDLKEGLRTSYKERLVFYQEMSGTAEIVTEKKRLIFKFIKPL